MADVGGPEIEDHDGVVEVKYNSDGVLAVEEGTEYSREAGEYDLSESDQVLTVEAGKSVYLDLESDFAAYGIEEFAKALVQSEGETEVFDPNRTKIWDTEDSDSGSESTPIFDPSKYEIGDPTEYVSMMKENADTIILELADRDVIGEEATETLDQLFSSMNDTYDRFVHSQTESSEDTELYDEESTEQEQGKRKLTKEEAEEHLDEVEQELSDDEATVDDYVDAERLLDEDTPPVEGQSEISDW